MAIKSYAALCAIVVCAACQAPEADDTPAMSASSSGAGGVFPSPAGGAGTLPASPGGVAGMSGASVGSDATPPSVGGSGVGGDASGASGAGGGGAGAAGTAGGPAAGGAALGPLVRADGFVDAAPPIGEPLPQAPAGTWTYVELAGTKCRDGSTAGLFVRYSEKSPNFFIYLEGGGVCLPVADWNAVYVPYCTGDIWGGSRPNATFPAGFEGLAGNTAGQHQFVGFDTTSAVLGRAVATFPDAQKVLISGSSAGGIGALLNAHRLADLLRAQGSQARGFVVSDSAVPFADTYLAACTQLWGLDQAFPSDCDECFNADGGGMASGLAKYFMKKFPDESQVLGGLISSVDDEIITLFYSSALPNCTPTSYDVGTYEAALDDFRDNVVGRKRFGTYFMPGTLHMHLWRSRFYETNGTSMSIADWLTKLLDNEAVHVEPQ